MREYIAQFVIGAVVIFGVVQVVQAIDARKYDVLEETTDSLLLVAAATDVRVAAADARHLADSIWKDSIRVVEAGLLDALAAREREGRRNRASLDSARATINEDTLSAGLRNLLLAERTMAESWRMQLVTVRDSVMPIVRVQLARAEAARDSLRVLVLTLVPERDAALEIIAGYQAQLDFNLWRWIGDEIPTLLACAAGGAIASVVGDGDAIVGAGIGVGSCVVVRAVF